MERSVKIGDADAIAWNVICCLREGGGTSLTGFKRSPCAISRTGLIQGVRADCIDQLALFPLAEHNRASTEFLASGSRSVALVPRMPDGFQVPDELALPLESLQQMEAWKIFLRRSRTQNAELPREAHR